MHWLTMIGFNLESGKQQRSNGHAQGRTFEMALLIHGRQFYCERSEAAQDKHAALKSAEMKPNSFYF
jgi:hypothetical protein